jgi:hypothetical protein
MSLYFITLNLVTPLNIALIFAGGTKKIADRTPIVIGVASRVGACCRGQENCSQNGEQQKTEPTPP